MAGLEGAVARRPRAAGSQVRRDVQGLRAIAVLLVLTDHIFRFPRGGFIGVDVFFVISGFLITGLLVREKQRSGRISMRDFYARRARRILPMAAVVIATTDVLSRIVFSSVRAHQSFVDSVASLFFFANFHFAAIGTSYFNAARPPSPFQQFWSLSVEEQFYLFWPLLLIVGFALAARMRVTQRYVVTAALATVMVVASFGFCIHFTSVNATGSYFSTASRAWELGVGALTAVVSAPLLRLPRVVRLSGSWLAVLTIVASAIAINETTAFPSFATLAPVLATAVILGVGEVRGGPGEAWAFGSPPSLYLGRISYSLYLWHWPARVFADAYFGKGLASHVGAAVVAVGLSAVSNELIEEPVRHSLWLSPKPPGFTRSRATIGDWWADHERVAMPTAIVLVAAISLLVWDTASTPVAPPARDVAVISATDGGGAVTTTTGVTDALAAAIKASISVSAWAKLDPSLDELGDAAAPEWTKDRCLNVSPSNLDTCRYGPANAPHLAVLVGDSVALSYLPGVREALTHAGWRVQSLTFFSCPFADIATSDGASRLSQQCRSHQRWVLSEVAKLRPDLVIASSASSRVPKLAPDLAAWRTATTQAVSALGAPSRRVVVLGGAPGSGNLEECVTVRSSPHDCLRPVPNAWYGVRDAERAGAESSGGRYVDPLAWFCYEGACPAVIGSTPVYWDGTHLTAAYARSLAPKLQEALLAP